MSSSHAVRGSTLLELIAVMAIAGILAAAALPSFGTLLLHRHLEGVAAQLHADLQFLRTTAAATQTGVRLDFHDSAAGTCYVMYAGSRGACACDGDTAPQCRFDTPALRSAGFAAESPVQVHANVGGLRVDPRHGTVTPAGTLRIVAADGSALHHVVSLLGRVRTCSVGASWSGVPPCEP